jgi:hypothetical protein
VRQREALAAPIGDPWDESTIRLGLGDKNACADSLNSAHHGDPHSPK